jgi:hypothetical protein
VKGGPFTDKILQGGSQPGVNQASLTVGVNWKVKVEGDATKCHCRYIDNGNIGTIFYFNHGNSPGKDQSFANKVTDSMPCKDYDDYPGAYFAMNLPDFTYSMRYNLSVTFECEDEDRSGKISDTVNINALFMGRYPPTFQF